MRVIDKIDAGTHYQKSELRNHYNRILPLVGKEGKLFIDDRNARSVAVMLSYGLYKEILQALNSIDEIQDELDLEIARSRANDKSKPITGTELKRALGIVTKKR